MEIYQDDLLEALRALLRCFNAQGTLIIIPSSSQFKPVENPHEAIDILTAARKAVADAEYKMAYEEGHSAAQEEDAWKEEPVSPYQEGTEEHSAWWLGYQEGFAGSA